ncbi:MAG: DUF1080 domain-containing protein [Phycisphaeraceae bacterium]|nr:DUF1080 domain-containing protein [Phycisphaeraceae bacterium]
MNQRHFVWFLTALLVAAATVSAKKPTWTDPAKAKAEDPDFLLQGEYSGTLKASSGKTMKVGLQVVALGGGDFRMLPFNGGLPGDGWDGRRKTFVAGKRDANNRLTFVSTISKQEGTVVIAGGQAKVTDPDGKPMGTLQRIERRSPTLGAKPPAGAVVLFDGSDVSKWKKGKLTSQKFLAAGTKTKDTFGSFKLHIEFRLPYKPQTPPSNQDRGNSGLYHFNRYECQVLDSFGMHYYPNTHPKSEWKQAFKKEFGYGPQSDRTQWCGSFYKFKTPDINVCYPPLVWQTYDITFTAPIFEGGKKTANARFTILHNGVKIHDDVELKKGTGAGGGRKEVPTEGLYLQGHGNPVVYRNIWLLPKK